MSLAPKEGAQKTTDCITTQKIVWRQMRNKLVFAPKGSTKHCVLRQRRGKTSGFGAPNAQNNMGFCTECAVKNQGFSAKGTKKNEFGAEGTAQNQDFGAKGVEKNECGANGAVKKLDFKASNKLSLAPKK